MAFQFDKTKKLVASLFILSLIVVMTTFALLGKFSNWLTDRENFYTEFNNTSSLKINARVVFKENGLDIGEVTKKELNQRNNKIRVYFEVDKKYLSRIREDSVVYQDVPLIGGLGETTISISIGSNAYRPIGSNRPIPSTDTEEGYIMLREKADSSVKYDLQTNMMNISSNISRLTRPGGELMGIFKNVEDITRQLKEGGQIQRLNDTVKNVSEKVDKSMTDINEITARLNRLVKNNAGRVDKTLLVLVDNVSIILNQISKTTKKILDKVVKQSDPILRDTQKAIRSILKDITTTVSSTTGSMENNVTASLKDFRIIMQNLKIISSRLNRLLDKVEKMPILGGTDKKKKPAYIDEIEREDY
ncbi:MAG: MlaD family protein [Spirochaetota bacterium]|nr:MlaD family protein [Spirochaetota bacterium]